MLLFDHVVWYVIIVWRSDILLFDHVVCYAGCVLCGSGMVYRKDDTCRLSKK